jgi:hypothetical protein
MTLNVVELTRLISLCFEAARDNGHFSLRQRRAMLLRGKVLRGHLINLVSAHWEGKADPEIAGANQKIAALNQRLKSTRKTLEKYAETVNDLADLAGVLEALLGLARFV